MIGTSPAAHTAQATPTQAERLTALVSLFEGRNPSASEPAGARWPQTHALTELADGLVELARGERRRVSTRVRAGDEAWEIGLELAAGAALVTVFTGGALPVVHVFERRLDPRAFAANLDLALADRVPAAGERERERIGAVRARLATVTSDAAPRDEAESVAVDPLAETTFGLAADVWLRPRRESSAPPSSVLRADLFALLFRGRIRIRAFEHEREIHDVHVFLVAEQLASLAHEALEAHASARGLLRKVQVGGAVCGIRLNHKSDGGPAFGAALTLGAQRTGVGRGETWTFPLVDLEAFAASVVDFGRALARAIVRRDRSQTHNLRLVEFRAKLREISDLCREVSRNDAIVNPSPESYRAYASQLTAPARDAEPLRARLRFAPRWQAAVPSLDLRATFLCGDALVVGSLRETCAVDRHTGTIVWKRSTPRATTVATPAGLARFDGEGQLTLLDIGTGETRFGLRLAPRVGAPVTGAVVTTPGLPRMLLLSEGKRHVAAIDLDAGEIAWRFAARRAGPFWIRRAGRLAIVSNGEQALTALDVVSGEVVWRFCDRLRFAGPVTVTGDALYAIAGDGAFAGRGGARLYQLDPWTGEARWSVALPPHARPVGAPLVGPDAVLVVTHDPRGTSVSAFSADTGARRFDREVCWGAGAGLVVDDVLVVNGESGELVALDARDGATRYRHVFTDGTDGDRPRRLEPVLRSGALFVPQTSVHVVRPHDGTLLGTVETDLIPDLLRVDERCDVYVAEESGHLAAFGAAARLTLVRS